MSQGQTSGRTFKETARHHGLLLLAIFAIVSSAGFLLGPTVRRSYRVDGQLEIRLHPFEPLGDLRRVAEGAVKELSDAAAAGGVGLAVDSGATSGETVTVKLESSAPTHAGAVAHIGKIAEEIGTRVRHRMDELASSYRSDLTKRSDRLAAAEEPLNKQIEHFRLTHRGVLPDDPSSIMAQYEKLSNRLDDKQQREHVVVEQISRLEAYKRGGTAVPPPAPLPAPTAAAGDGAAAPKAESDPEVLSLNAQIQLISDQLDDQLNNKHRTEQHPYVQDLRTQQADLQKKLDAAKARVAAGGAPPANIHVPQASGAANDPTLASAQAADFQIQALQAERDTLDVDIKTLTAERTNMQKQVDEVLPIRRDYEKLTAALDATQKEHQTVTAAAAQFDRMFAAEPGGAGGGEASSVVMDVVPVSYGAEASLPTFPGLFPVYAIALFLAAGATAIAGWILYATDRTLHSTHQAAAQLDLPILGTVMELRPPAAAFRRRLWITALRPSLAILMVAITVGSAVLCYRHLADSGFSDTLHERGVSALVSAIVPNGGAWE